MWQRIQTLWLLLAGLIVTLLLFFPVVYWRVGSEVVEMFTLWTKNQSSEHVYIVTWDLFIVAAIVVVLSFVCIFLFKKRKLQMRLCLYNILLILGYIIDVIVRIFIYSKQEGLPWNNLTPTLWSVLPFLAIIFEILAFRGIRKDDVLIRMSNRLR